MKGGKVLMNIQRFFLVFCLATGLMLSSFLTVGAEPEDYSQMFMGEDISLANWDTAVKSGSSYLPWTSFSNNGFSDNSSAGTAIYKGGQFANCFQYMINTRKTNTLCLTKVYFNAQYTIMANGSISVQSGYCFNIVDSDTITKVDLVKISQSVESQPIASTEFQNGMVAVNADNVIRITYNIGTITFSAKSDTSTAALSYTDQQPYTSGYIGIGHALKSTVWFKNISVTNLTNIISSSLDGVPEVSVLPSIEVVFSLPVEAGTVTKENVYLQNSDGKLSDLLFNLTLSDDGKTLILQLNKPLEYKTEYDLVVTDKICRKGLTVGLPGDYIVRFKTSPSSFDVSSFYALDGNGGDILGSDLTLIKGQIINIGANISYTGTSIEQSYAVIFALLRGNGELLWSKCFESSIPTGKDDSLIVPLAIPDDVTSDCYFTYYVWTSTAEMKALYPNADKGDVYNDNGITPSFSDADGIIRISGTSNSGLEGRTVTMLLFNPGFDLTDVLEAEAVQKVAETKTTANGEYFFEFYFHVSEGSSSCDYQFFIGGDDYLQPIKATFFYASPIQRNNTTKTFNAITDTHIMEKAITDSLRIFGLEEFKPINVITKTRLAEILAEHILKDKFNEDDGGSELITFLKKQSLLEAFNQGKSDVVFGKQGEFLYNNIIDYSTVDNLLNVNAYSVYRDNITSEGNQLVRNGLLNKSFDSETDLFEVFVEQVVLSGIDNWNVDGYGHIKGLLNKNKSAVGLELKEYNSLSSTVAVDRELLGAHIGTITQLNSKISELVKAQLVTPPTPAQSDSSNRRLSLGSSIKVGVNQPGINLEPTIREGSNKDNSVVFKDMAGFEWASEAVQSLVGKGIIQGDGNGSFCPDSLVTREEFVKLVVLGLGYSMKQTGSVHFSDVKADDWFAKYIETAFKIGILKGNEDQSFGVGVFITREEVATLIFRACEQGDTSVVKDTDLSRYSDSSKISPYAYSAMQFSVGEGIMIGVGDGLLSPQSGCTRAQAAVILFRVIERTTTPIGLEGGSKDETVS